MLLKCFNICSETPKLVFKSYTLLLKSFKKVKKSVLVNVLALHAIYYKGEMIFQNSEGKVRAIGKFTLHDHGDRTIFVPRDKLGKELFEAYLYFIA